MTKENHEVRFKITEEEKITLDRLHKQVGSEFLKTAFYKRLLFKGMESILNEVLIKKKDSEEIIKSLFSKKK